MALLLLAAVASDAPICADRPAKANAVCTVPAGRFQIEAAPLDWLRTDEGGTRVDALYAGSTVIKYGLTARSDLEIGFTPYVRIRTNGETRSGAGDAVVRFKYRLSASDAPVKVGLIPFAKLPTAGHGIGNGKLEGGVALPVSFAAKALTVTVGPEVDVEADADGSGYHLAVVNVFNLSGTIAPGLTLGGELWSNVNFDPGGTVKQASADAALAYAVTNDLQLDAGANVGLSRDTPDIELYLGVSVRF